MKNEREQKGINSLQKGAPKCSKKWSSNLGKNIIPKSLENGIVKIHQGFTLNSPQGFAKGSPTESPENVPTRVRPPRVPETTQKSKHQYCTILSAKIYAKPTKKRPSRELPGDPFWPPEMRFLPPPQKICPKRH